jgi:hypothetical protein
MKFCRGGGPEEFVTRSGHELRLAGRNFRFVGANFSRIVYLSLDQMRGELDNAKAARVRANGSDIAPVTE